MSARHELAESRVLDLLDASGLPKPDTIEHGESCVRFLWSDRKVAVVIELDELPDDHGDSVVLVDGVKVAETRRVDL